MPRASGPHAVVCALRTASASPDAVALAQFWPSPNATQTSHSTFCADTVVHARNATNPRMARTIRTLRGMAPGLPARLPGPKRPRYCCTMLATARIRGTLGLVAALAMAFAQAAPLSAGSHCADPAEHAEHPGMPAGHHESNNSAPAHSNGCPHCPPTDCATQAG